MRLEPVILAVVAGLLAGCGSRSRWGPIPGMHARGLSRRRRPAWWSATGTVVPIRSRPEFSPAALSELQSILAAGAASPAAERAAIGRMVQWNERRVAPLVGSAGDVPGMDLVNAGKPGQMDCIDEATNTTRPAPGRRTQRVAAPSTRSNIRWSGASSSMGEFRTPLSVVRANTDGVDWAVDSWRLANGQPPDIMTLKHWLKRDHRKRARETGRG